MITRVLQQELLDELHPNDLAAVASRRDLNRLNLFMGHRAILARALADAGGRVPTRLVELGAGDGSLALRVAGALSSRWPAIHLTLVDRQPVVTDATRAGFRKLGWTPEVVTADALEWIEKESGELDLIFANLFLHHFTDAHLRQLFNSIALRTRVFVALEPRRSNGGLLGCRLLGLAGCNRVTKHDAPVSVRAGFRGRELSVLWPVGEPWKFEECRAGLFSHLFAARCESP